MLNVYSGHFKDDAKLLASASGGAATALAESVISKNGVVFGVRYSADFRSAEYCCIEEIDDLGQIKGSKYIQAQRNNIFHMVEEKLAENRLVLFVGLGCDIAAIKSYCRMRSIDTYNLYTVDILCHGPSPKEVQESYVIELEKKYGAIIKEFTIRFKKEGWFPFYIRAVFSNGSEHIESFNNSDFGRAFYYISKPSCTQCQFKGKNHQGDLCIGDYWGLSDKMSGWNKNGVSIIVVQSEKGKHLLSILPDDFVIQKADQVLFLRGNPMYENSRKQVNNYNEFMNDLRAKGLHFAVSKLPRNRVSFLDRVRKAIKRTTE